MSCSWLRLPRSSLHCHLTFYLVIIGWMCISHTSWEHPEGMGVCDHGLHRGTALNPSTAGWLLYGCFKGFPGWME